MTRGENKEGEEKLGGKEMDGASGEEREEEGWRLIGRRETSCEKFLKRKKLWRAEEEREEELGSEGGEEGKAS